MESNFLAELGSTFKYRPGGDVQSVWRKYGWTPPSEYRNDYLFAQTRECNQESTLPQSD
jgi:hypothetical protein